MRKKIISEMVDLIQKTIELEGFITIDIITMHGFILKISGIPDKVEIDYGVTISLVGRDDYIQIDLIDANIDYDTETDGYYINLPNQISIYINCYNAENKISA